MNDDLTVSVELSADEFDSYGALLAYLADTYDLSRLSVDFNTPSSASAPLVTLTFRDQASADLFALDQAE